MWHIGYIALVILCNLNQHQFTFLEKISYEPRDYMCNTCDTQEAFPVLVSVITACPLENTLEYNGT